MLLRLSAHAVAAIPSRAQPRANETSLIDIRLIVLNDDQNEIDK